MDLMDLKKRIAARRPAFFRTEWFRYKKLKAVWRKPRGITNKIRLCKRGKPAMPDSGYRSPKAVRGLHPSGLLEVLVFNPNQLDAIDPKAQGARIGGTVGKRKRGTILKKADDLGIQVFNR